MARLPPPCHALYRRLWLPDRRTRRPSPLRTVWRRAPRYGRARWNIASSLAWLIADRYPERLASLTMLSRPHPASFARALAMPDGEQAYRSRHHREFLDPAAGPRLLADDAAWVRTRLARNGVPEAAIAAHLSVIGNPPAMTAALAWYRAPRHPPGDRPDQGADLVHLGRRRRYRRRPAAEGTGEFIAADYQFAALPGVGHYAADQVPEQVQQSINRARAQGRGPARAPSRAARPSAAHS